jgi:hypothetical protein
MKRRRLRRLVPDEELIRRRAAGEPLRELALDYDVDHSTLSRYFARPEVVKEIKAMKRRLQAESRALADRQAAERRLEREVRRLAKEQTAREREYERHAEAVAAQRSARRRRPRTDYEAGWTTVMRAFHSPAATCGAAVMRLPATSLRRVAGFRRSSRRPACVRSRRSETRSTRRSSSRRMTPTCLPTLHFRPARNTLRRFARDRAGRRLARRLRRLDGAPKSRGRVPVLGPRAACARELRGLRGRVPPARVGPAARGSCSPLCYRARGVLWWQ